MQSTVDGQVGVYGLHAVNPAELALDNVPEPALTHVHLMEGDIVIIIIIGRQAVENKCATHNRALVS